jgi:two-component system phosphate regulon sensor histidine kinase PhoR
MDPKFSHHFVEVIGRHTERLQRLLDDLLDLARIESGHTPPSMEPIRADALMDAAAGTVASLAQSRGVELIREPTEEPLVIRGDRRQLEQALVNLLDNAVKYTDPPGRVVLSIRRRDREVHLEVSDTGVGIPEEHIPRIFERFYRVDKARSRQLGGTGLGLAIVKHIVQAHGGRVEVESTPGKGSTFRVVLPG